MSLGFATAFGGRPEGLEQDSELVTDDDASVFEADIDRLGTAGVTRGCNPPTNDRFCPEDLVTRGQMAAFLVRALGYTDTGGGDAFSRRRRLGSPKSTLKSIHVRMISSSQPPMRSIADNCGGHQP